MGSTRQRVLVRAAMTRIVLSVVILITTSSPQPQLRTDSGNARILQEQRFNTGGGRFGSAYAQDDGSVFREESTGGNNRLGQYSYVGHDGKTYTVRYSAGVDGFRIQSGDHIPSGGQTAAAAGEGVEEEYDYQYYDDTPQQSVFVNPHDPSHRQEFLLAGNLAGHLGQRVFPTPQPAAQQSQEPTPRFLPPGQIKLDRFQDGFNFHCRAEN